MRGPVGSADQRGSVRERVTSSKVPDDLKEVKPHRDRQDNTRRIVAHRSAKAARLSRERKATLVSAPVLGVRGQQASRPCAKRPRTGRIFALRGGQECARAGQPAPRPQAHCCHSTSAAQPLHRSSNRLSLCDLSPRAACDAGRRCSRRGSRFDPGALGPTAQLPAAPSLGEAAAFCTVLARRVHPRVAPSEASAHRRLLKQRGPHAGRALSALHEAQQLRVPPARDLGGRVWTLRLCPAAGDARGRARSRGGPTSIRRTA